MPPSLCILWLGLASLYVARAGSTREQARGCYIPSTAGNPGHLETVDVDPRPPCRDPAGCTTSLPPDDPDANGSDAAGHAQLNTGKMTYYDLNLGSCGFNDSGEESNANPLCGRTIAINYNGKVTSATMRDKCMGCSAGNIDVSRAAFLYLVGSLDAGKVNVEWWFQ